jgi:hypothetical protein
MKGSDFRCLCCIFPLRFQRSLSPQAPIEMEYVHLYMYFKTLPGCLYIKTRTASGSVHTFLPKGVARKSFPQARR